MAKLLRYGHEYKHDPHLHYDVLDGKLFREFKQAFGMNILPTLGLQDYYP